MQQEDLIKTTADTQAPGAQATTPGAQAATPGARAASGGAAADDALRLLEERLHRASEVAERLVSNAASETTAAAAKMRERLKPQPAGEGMPAQGWQTPGQDQQQDSLSDMAALVALLESFRELISPELRQRLAEALKELLLALRALIDWHVERIDRRQEQPAEIEDIPIV